MMARKKDNTTLWIIGAVAIAGYFAFRSGGFLNKSTTGSPVTSLPMVPYNPAGIATELPSAETINVYTPSLDPTGQSLQLF
jgi:glutaminase